MCREERSGEVERKKRGEESRGEERRAEERRGGEVTGRREELECESQLSE